jgi:hypothetical protein
MLVAQNLILMGIFFTIPLYLQIVQGFDALETGLRMLPASVGLFVAALAGSRLASRFSPFMLVRAGLVVILGSTLLILGVIDPEIDTTAFLVAMGVLGVGMGLTVSQLGNVVQSAVGDADRSEAGGLQNTAQQLGSSLGTALLGAVVITGLIGAFSDNVASDDRVDAEAQQQVEVALAGKVSFVATDQVEQAALDAGLDQDTADALVDDYSEAQLKALKTAILFAAFITAGSFLLTRNLPREPLVSPEAGAA